MKHLLDFFPNRTDNFDLYGDSVNLRRQFDVRLW